MNMVGLFRQLVQTLSQALLLFLIFCANVFANTKKGGRKYEE
ncbi:MAG: hypothetical protein WAM41_18275 [Psychrobacillus psychrotolerans]